MKEFESKLDYALQASKEGWSVIPLHSNKKTPARPWKQRQVEPFNPDNIKEMWATDPDYNIGIVTGRLSGISVLDVDGKKGFDSLNDAGISLPKTFTVKTKRGFHYYYQYHPDIQNSNGILPKVDLKSDGGLIVGAGSMVEGVQYSVYDDCPIAEWKNPPPILLKTSQIPKGQVQENKDSPSDTNPLLGLGDIIPEGQRDQTLFNIALVLMKEKNFTEEECLRLVNVLNDNYTVSKEDPEVYARLSQAQVAQKVRQASAYAVGEPLPIFLGSDLVAKPVEWLLPGRIPFGKLSMLAGFSGVGKSLALTSLMSSLSTGDELPDGSTRAPMKTLYITAEDGAEDTIRVRADDMGGDPDMYYVLSHSDMSAKGLSTNFNNPKTLKDLRAFIVANDIGFMIFDPITSFAGSLDSRGDILVRKFLLQFSDMADTTGCAILGILHFNKDRKAESLLQRISGSHAFTAVPRVVLVIRDSPGDDSRKLLEVHKNNLYQKLSPIGFKIEPILDEDDEPVDGRSCISWEGELEDAASTKPIRKRLAPKAVRAKKFLRDVLHDGGISSLEITKQAKQLDISEDTLRKAREDLGIVVKKHGRADGSRGIDHATWELPA